MKMLLRCKVKKALTIIEIVLIFLLASALANIDDSEPDVEHNLIRSKREKLSPQDGGHSFMHEYLKETFQFEIEPDPPMKSKEWFEGLEAAWEKLNEEWEQKQLRQQETDSAGPDDHVEGSFLDNPVNEIQNPAEKFSTGGADPYMNIGRLSHLARLRGDKNASFCYQGLPDAPAKFDFEGRGNWSEERDKRSGWTLLGQEYWGENFELEGTMNANTDPWFCAEQADNSVGQIYQGEWVDKTVEERVQMQLKKMEEMYKRDEGNKTEVNYTGYQDSLDPEWDKFIYEHIDRPLYMTDPVRLSSVFESGNTWALNDSYVGDAEWDPVLPERVWTMNSKHTLSLNTFRSASAIQEEFYEDAGWLEPNEDRHLDVKSSPEDDDGGDGDLPYGFIRVPLPYRPPVAGDMGFGRLGRCIRGLCPRAPYVRVSKLRLNA
ncbi:hypothetical protein GUITHDRAFT_109766 [Guillardia theta CCMP2712]|uniref:Uncharacterized protein n=1 Tax=Guillardia theta (strain CCMP2712) TaxID=905079 RepID=L1J7N0_GUITC|nr:hypothetical protein GUITHDRAFT_109766 [Guillardia theta CCMP2712]EKX44312.1 hypothetical protein GUITHDRAFT_109766 [Guillardia theta CCMP2712]|eukprot:XP_005831292.1 hypothetical protein GUITHDRAFT_109766 [Guillardia theta CCMP2712]